MNSLRFVCRRSIYQIRQFHKCVAQQADAAATATSKASVSSSVNSNNNTEVSPKIDQIANQIVNLNLIEVAQLSEVLKTRLNLPDAPVMPVGPVAAVVEEEVEPTVVQTSFTVKLTGFDETKKISLIKELKNILPDCNLVQAKKFVDSVPAVVQMNIVRDEAEKLKDTLTKVGGTVEIE